jgi:hypothetical protein
MMQQRAAIPERLQPAACRDTVATGSPLVAAGAGDDGTPIDLQPIPRPRHRPCAGQRCANGGRRHQPVTSA